MSGRIITLFQKRQLEYSFLAASSSTSITLRKAIGVPQFYAYRFDLRVHNASIVSGAYTFNLFQTLPTSEDPQEFTASTAALALVVDSTTVSPALLTISSSNLGPYFKLAVTCAQGGGAGRFYAEVSATLHVRAP